MAVARGARVALALVIAAIASPAAAQSMARVVSVYPFARSEGAAAEDAQGLLESALQRAANRVDDVVLSEPLFVRPACGPSQTAPVECLVRLAGKGLLLRAVLHKSERSAALAIEAIDGASGRAVGPVTVGIDTYIQNAEPLARALLMLFEDARGRGGRLVARPLAPPPPGAPVQPKAEAPRSDVAKGEPPRPPPKPDLRAAEPEPAARVAAAEAGVSRAAPRRSWARAMAPYVAGAGLALLAGAAVVSVKNEQLSTELDQKAREGTLTVADQASYDKVKRYNTMTIGLAAAGGVLTVTSAVMFTVVPSHGGGSVAMAGRF